MAIDVLDRVEKMAKLAAKKPKTPEKNEPKESLPVTNVVQLPMWPEQMRGMPNSIARSALFNVRFKKTKRVDRKNYPIAALKGINIVYTGEELRQDDETIFLQL